MLQHVFSKGAAILRGTHKARAHYIKKEIKITGTEGLMFIAHNRFAHSIMEIQDGMHSSHTYIRTYLLITCKAFDFVALHTAVSQCSGIAFWSIPAS